MACVVRCLATVGTLWLLAVGCGGVRAPAHDGAAGSGGQGGSAGAGGSGGADARDTPADTPDGAGGTGGGTGGSGGAGGTGGGAGGTGGGAGGTGGGTGGSGGSSGAGGSDDAGCGSDAAAGELAPGETSTGTMACGGKPFPAFDKTCAGDADCAIAMHLVDCCGNSVALGINKKESAAFAAAEKDCEAIWGPGGCGCPTFPPRAEDGSVGSFGADSIAVGCFGGACMTYGKACGAPCGAGLACLCCVKTSGGSYCACSTTCTSDGDCTNPTRPQCQTGGYPQFCAPACAGCWGK